MVAAAQCLRPCPLVVAELLRLGSALARAHWSCFVDHRVLAGGSSTPRGSTLPVNDEDGRHVNQARKAMKTQIIKPRQLFDHTGGELSEATYSMPPRFASNPRPIEQGTPW